MPEEMSLLLRLTIVHRGFSCRRCGSFYGLMAGYFTVWGHSQHCQCHFYLPSTRNIISDHSGAFCSSRDRFIPEVGQDQMLLKHIAVMKYIKHVLNSILIGLPDKSEWKSVAAWKKSTAVTLVVFKPAITDFSYAT